MKNHHTALLKTKKNLDTFKKPAEHIDKKAKPSGKGTQLLKNAYDFEEVVVSFKKVAQIKKGYIDTKAPKCMETKKLREGGNHKTKTDFEMAEHKRNTEILKSNLKRLKSAGKPLQERKKNVYDPVAHPVRFFRRDPLDPMTNKVAKKMGIELDCLANKLINRRDVVGIDNSSLLRRQIQNKRPGTAG